MASDHGGIVVVPRFDDLVATPFAPDVNAVCWERPLFGDFRELVESLASRADGTAIDDDVLHALTLSAAGHAAREFLLNDLRLLRKHGATPIVDCIREYPRDETNGPVVTDVYSFHADSAPVATETFLCTYYGAPSEGLPNDEAVRRIDIPEVRAQLLKHFGGHDDGEFLEHLRAHSYDLHYAPTADATPYSFGVGALWRIAVEYPNRPVPPCIHRAPATPAGPLPRLLLIS